MTVGVGNQWRAEVKGLQKGGKRGAWRGGAIVDFVMTYANGLFVARIGEETLKLSSSADFSKGGRVFLGQTVKNVTETAYIPLYGGRITGSIVTTESGVEPQPIPPVPPVTTPPEVDDEENEESQDILRDIRSRLLDIVVKLDKLIKG